MLNIKGIIITYVVFTGCDIVLYIMRMCSCNVLDMDHGIAYPLLCYAVVNYPLNPYVALECEVLKIERLE